MILSAEEFVRLRTSQSPEEYRRAANDSAPIDVWMEVIDRHHDMRRWVVHNKTVPTVILELLSRVSEESVRHAVAMKRKCPAEVLERLASDPCDAVRIAVARNPKTPTSILQTISSDTDDHIANIAEEAIKNRTR